MPSVVTLALLVVTHASFQVDMTLKFRVHLVPNFFFGLATVAFSFVFGN